MLSVHWGNQIVETEGNELMISKEYCTSLNPNWMGKNKKKEKIETGLEEHIMQGNDFKLSRQADESLVSFQLDFCYLRKMVIFGHQYKIQADWPI